MTLGAFSISLTVKDIAASRAFYEALGFEASGGNQDQGWLILRNPDGVVIGLFQGMFERNMLTFNPGWDQSCAELDTFTDVRELHKRLAAAGLEVTGNTGDSKAGPAHITLTDPDGNPILIDQHR